MSVRLCCVSVIGLCYILCILQHFVRGGAFFSRTRCTFTVQTSGFWQNKIDAESRDIYVTCGDRSMLNGLWSHSSLRFHQCEGRQSSYNADAPPSLCFRPFRRAAVTCAIFGNFSRWPAIVVSRWRTPSRLHPGTIPCRVLQQLLSDWLS